jgi:uncharacterized protein YdeI (YjbR/CyaY-like superfamily)
MAERLYLTMEGEKELPPILRAAFQRRPLAEAGWKALTPIQRRNHLFMIFGCRSVESREKRVRAAIESALSRSEPASGPDRAFGSSPRRTLRDDWEAEAPEM